MKDESKSIAVKGEFIPGLVLQDNTYIMDTKNLFAGQIVKNYKEMCQLVGEPTRTGRGKQWQQKNWLNFIDWRINGQAYHIIAVYENPNAPTLIKKLSHQELCLSLLVSNVLNTMESFAIPDHGEIVYSRIRLAYIFGLVNRKFVEEHNKYAKNSEEDKAFFSEVKYKNWEIIQSLLFKLENSNFIVFRQAFSVFYEGKQLVTSPEETSKIQEIYTRCVSLMSAKTVQELYLQDRLFVYYKMAERLIKEELGYDSPSKVYVFNANRFSLKFFLKKYLALFGLGDIFAESNDRNFRKLIEFFEKEARDYTEALDDIEKWGLATKKVKKVDASILASKKVKTKTYVQIDLLEEF